MVEALIMISTAWMVLHLYTVPTYYYYYILTLICVSLVITVKQQLCNLKTKEENQGSGFIYSLLFLNLVTAIKSNSEDDFTLSDERVSYFIITSMALTGASLIDVLFKYVQFVNKTTKIMFIVVVGFIMICFIKERSTLIYVSVIMLYEIISTNFFLTLFPDSFSFGGISLTMQAYGMVCSSLIYTYTNVSPEQLQNDGNSAKHFIICFLIFSSSIIIVVAGIILITKKYLEKTGIEPLVLCCDVLLYFSTLSLFYIFFFYIFYIYIGKSIVVWLIDIFLSDTFCMLLLVYWLFIVFVCCCFVYINIHNKCFRETFALTIIRKFFHLAAVLIFLPVLYDKHNFVAVTSSIVFVMFIGIEFIRCTNFTWLGKLFNSSFSIFRDEQDSGILILTNIYLLFGLSFPIWLNELHYEKNTIKNLLSYSGVISIGVGDTFASLVGTLFGDHRWPNTKKTYLGTFSCLVSQFLFTVFLLFVLSVDISFYLLVLLFLGFTFISLLETFSEQVDNLILPIYTCIVLHIVCDSA